MDASCLERHKTRNDTYGQDYVTIRMQRQQKHHDGRPTSLTSEMYVYKRPIRKITDVTDVREMSEFQPIEFIFLMHLTGN